jgi:pSer/pThr/pTyr-binding forkhead associated (FHA) protein
MAKLQFSLEGSALGEYELDKERITIGRRAGNDIHIDNLAVSGDHAVITTIGGDSFLEDMNSTNGTLVNGKSVKKHVLHHQDVIEFGKYQLLYINVAQSKIPANHGGFQNTVVMRPAKLSVVAAEATDKAEDKTEAKVYQQEAPQTNEAASEAVTKTAVSQPIAPAATVDNAPKVGRLKMLNGANTGREITLSKALTTLGKAGTQVSVITKRPHGYFITHVEGENLPFINGQKIGLQAHALIDHDVIDMAGLKMEFFLA